MPSLQERKARRRAPTEAGCAGVKKQAPPPDVRQLALPIELQPAPLPSFAVPATTRERGAILVGKTDARLVLSGVEWVFDRIVPPCVLPLSLTDALEVGTVAKAEPATRFKFNKDANGPQIEYGIHAPDLHEYFVSKASGMTGVIHIKRKEDGSWSAGLAKSNVPFVLTSDAVEKGIMPPDGRSGLPASLEATVPGKFQYWKHQGEQALAVRNALVESGFFPEDMIKVVDGEFRLCASRLFLYEPPVEAAKAKSAEPAAPRTLVDVLKRIIPADVIAKGLATPVAAGVDADEVIKADDGKLMLFSTDEDAKITRIVDLIAKGACAKHWLIEHDDKPEVRKQFAKIGRVFKVDSGDARGRVFAASFRLADEKLVRFLDKRHLPITKEMGGPGKVELPPDHVPVVQVPKGGSSCSTCKFLGDDGASCMNQYVAQWAGADAPVPLPHAADETCSDWWEPREALATGTKPAAKNVELEKRQITRLVLQKADAAETPADERYVLGIVLEPDVVDAQNDTYSAEEVRSTAFKYMEKYRTIGFMHKGAINDKVKILESFIAPVDMEVGDQPIKKGTWVMGIRVLDDELWKAIKDGDLTGFSIGGSAIRKPEATTPAQ